MATILFSAVGTLVGGPIGGVIGALVGRQVDSALLGGQNRQGPRLKELEATTSSYGTPIPRHFGHMRVPGSVIWATDLVEHTSTDGGGKNQPKVTTYSYTASFAVAVSSRRIIDIGRIWADGNLLRGASGDLKAPGTMRIYRGFPDQGVDPLMAATEGEMFCPAHRGLAYVVFEDLELGDFFNRIPALTFEVIAENASFNLQDMVGEVIEDVDADYQLSRLYGFTMEGPLVDTLRLLEPIFPVDSDASGEKLTLAKERLQSAPIALPEPAVSVDDGDFGGTAGYSRKRSPPAASPPEILRYYDLDRDYLPGLQRALGRTMPGEPQTVELPAAMSSADARILVERLSRQVQWSREQLAWRTAELDPRVSPGAIVHVPGQSGRWRVQEWEWRESGVELTLHRVIPTGVDAPLGGDAPPLQDTDPGRINPPVDEPAPPSVLAAFELPWDGAGNGDTPATFAAVSSPGSRWSGAALYVDRGDGSLEPLGGSGRTRALIGAAETALAPANPLVFDRSATVTVAMIDPDMSLLNASARQLAMGGNRALIGNEIIQYARAEPLGGGHFRLSGLLRGRGGTESAIAGHAAGDGFVLLDAQPVRLDPALVGATPGTLIVAVGRGDTAPVSSPIAQQGIALRPLSPVHPRHRVLDDGTLELGWTRRARGAWSWLDGVDTPLHEQAESYQVSFGPVDAPVAVWSVAEARLAIAQTVIANLTATLPGGALHVRQQGSYALSEPLYLAMLS